MHQFLRHVNMECLRKEVHITHGRDRLDAWYQRNSDPHSPDGITEFKKLPVIKKHLCYNVTGTGIHLALQVNHVAFEVGSLEVLLRISGNTDAE